MFNSDPELVRRCLHGKNEAFVTLYDRHAPRVFRILRQITGNVSEAEDLTQETFLAAYHGLASWRGEGAFGTWLCGIAYRRYTHACRGRVEDTEPLDTHEELCVPDSDPMLHCTRQERVRMLEATIGHLPTACREAFVLVKVEGLSYREAARMLDIPIGTVQSRLSRAVRLLQSALASEYPDVAAKVAATQRSRVIPYTDQVLLPTSETQENLNEV